MGKVQRAEDNTMQLVILRAIRFCGAGHAAVHVQLGGLADIRKRLASSNFAI